MAVYLKPTYEEEKSSQSAVAVEATELPGVEGLNMTMLVGAMVLGSSMWLGILYVGNVVLQAIAG